MMAAGRHCGSVSRVFGGNQRTTDHTGRRRHPLAQCRAATVTGSFRLPPPVQYFKGVPSPVKHPEKVNMVIFRENTEDIYAGIEYAAGTPEAQKILGFLQKDFPKEFDKIRFGTKEKANAFLEDGWRKRER